MRKVINVAIILALYSIQAVAFEYPWKTQPPFEISFVDGYQEFYEAEERISFYVEGRSPAGIETAPQHGFNVQVHISDPAAQKSHSAANGAYDENRRAWLVELSAPKDNTKSYTLDISLYCGIDNSQCAEIYGVAAQTTKTFNLQVR